MTVPIRRSSHNGGEVARPDLFGDLQRLNRDLASHLDAWRTLPNLLDEAFTPSADVEETDDAYLVEVEVPGVKRDDVNIEIAGRRVSIRGERKEKTRVGVLRRRERTVGRFTYEVTLPGDVDDDAVEAHLDEGVLTVRLAKPAHDRPRRIEIH